MIRPRVFLDANVLFSASNHGSAFARLIDWASVRADLVSSDLARLEAERNLTLKRPVWLDGFESLCDLVDWVATTSFPLEVELADKDVPLLCAAIRARCEWFVTGDRRDFGHLFGVAVHGTTVIPPIELPDRLEEASS